MKSLNSNLTFLLFLLTVASAGEAMAIAQIASSTGELSYSPKAVQSQNEFVFRSPRGERYRLSLVPDKDVAGRTVVLELVLRRQGNKVDDDSNLLDTTGSLHGYQPYFLAASDFSHGAQQSTYGDTRTMKLRKLGLRIQVKIVSVEVEPMEKKGVTPQQYQFSDLHLAVLAQEPKE